jgi:hypothetical protein
VKVLKELLSVDVGVRDELVEKLYAALR